MSGRTSTLNLLILVAGSAIILSTGCYQDATAPTGVGAADEVRQLTRGGGPGPTGVDDTSQCATSSAILQVNQGLALDVGASRAEFRGQSVLRPTVVSFSICNLDSTGTLLRSKAAVFGPLAFYEYFKPFKVKLDPGDAGVSESIPNGTSFALYRQNESNGTWDSILTGRITQQKVEYAISRNGTYAVRLTDTAVDTTWTATALVPPSGGAVTLLGSSIVIPAGALSNATLISFAMTTGITPIGLPGATDRVFDFGPDGTVFLVPVRLSVSFEEAGFDESAVPAEEAAPLALYYFNPATSGWEQQPTTTDWEHRQFVVNLSHFSRYAFGR